VRFFSHFCENVRFLNIQVIDNQEFDIFSAKNHFFLLFFLLFVISPIFLHHT